MNKGLDNVNIIINRINQAQEAAWKEFHRLLDKKDKDRAKWILENIICKLGDTLAKIEDFGCCIAYNDILEKVSTI